MFGVVKKFRNYWGGHKRYSSGYAVLRCRNIQGCGRLRYDESCFGEWAGIAPTFGEGEPTVGRSPKRTSASIRKSSADAVMMLKYLLCQALNQDALASSRLSAMVLLRGSRNLYCPQHGA